MKKLICAKDIESLYGQGDYVIMTDKQTIITPAATDLAAEYQMTFKQVMPEKINSLSGTQEMTKEYLVSLLKSILNDNDLSVYEQLPYESETHASGIKIVRGSTIKCSPINENNPRVRYQSISSSEESPLDLGLLEIDESYYAEVAMHESIQYVISGKLQVTIDETIIEANAGDIIFVPENVKVKWSTPSKVTILVGKLKSGG